MRVLVTGATGFLGGAVVHRLREAGHTVVATGRSSVGCNRLADAGFQTHQVDLSAPITGDAFGALDAVVHTAALSAPWGRRAAFEAANIDATRTVIAIARQAGVRRFVNISSPSVSFALKDQLDVKESDPLPRPFNHYARSKAEAERLVLDTPDIGPISLRPRGIYGRGDTALLPRLLAAAKARPLPVFRRGVAKIDLTHIDDVVRAVGAALEADATAQGQAFNISSGQVLPVRHIIEAACARAGQTPRWRALPLRPALLIARLLEAGALLVPAGQEPPVTAYGLALLAYEQSLNIDKARTLLGWSPSIDFETGLSRTFEGVGKCA